MISQDQTLCHSAEKTTFTMPSENIALGHTKDGGQVQSSAAEDVEYVHKGRVAPKYMGTLADQRDMSALGREQVLRVRYRNVSPLDLG